MNKAAVITLLLLTILSLGVEAATIDVPGGLNYTIQGAINAANNGDTINVASGTYYENQVVVNRSLTIRGAGTGSTIIDGSSVTNLPTIGLVRITNDGDVNFTGFTVRNAGVNLSIVGNGGMPVRVGIYASSDSAGNKYDISYNRIIGSGNPLDEEDYGFYSHSGKEELEFTHNVITQTGSNAILLERHSGPTEVSFNTFDRGVASTSVDPYFNMNYGGADITSMQKVRYNTIDMGTGTVFNSSTRGFAITFASSFTGADQGGFTNVRIEGNTISNLKPYRRGIGLWNNAPGDGSLGNFASPIIEGNTITGEAGSTGSIGIRLLGLATGAIITDNEIDSVDTSFLGGEWNTHIATGTLLSQNSFTNIFTGLSWAGTEILNAENNWWGQCTGPAPLSIVGNVDFTPWSGACFNLNVNSPLNAQLYDKKKIVFNITTGENVKKLEFIDYSERKPRWNTLCSKCEEYGLFRLKTRTFNDGDHNLTIRATDDFGQVNEKNVSFSVDSTIPRISSTRPRRNQAVNGMIFSIKYTEGNLKDIIFHYGTSSITKSCTPGINQECFFENVNLTSYDGQWIDFWFDASDYVRTVSSRTTRVFVDTTAPELAVYSPINDSDQPRKVVINFTASEPVKVEYYDSSEYSPRWKILCSRCDKYARIKSFAQGSHEVTIMATDQAGNTDQEVISFNVA